MSEFFVMIEFGEKRAHSLQWDIEKDVGGGILFDTGADIRFQISSNTIRN